MNIYKKTQALFFFIYSLFIFSQSSIPVYTLPKIKSNITLPVSLPVSEINNLINQSVKGVLYEDQSYTDNNNDQFKVRVEKQGNIAIKALSNNRLMISVPLKIWAEKGYGTLGYYMYQDTNFNLIMNFITSLAATPDWKLNTKTTTAGFVWTQKPVLDYGKVKIPIASFIESVLKEQQNKFTTVIDQQIKSQFNLQPQLVMAWNQFSKPINVSQEYNTWLKISPQNTYMTPLQVFQDKIKTTVGIDLFSETFVGKMPLPTKDVTSIPNFVVKPDLQNIFNLQTTANISFDEATKIARQQFLNKEFPLNSEKNKVKVDDIKVYGEKENIVIEVKTQGGVTGTAFIKGKPAYDVQSHKIVLTQTDFNLKTKNFFQKALTVLFEGKIRKMIEKDYGIPLMDIENSSKKSLMESFNKEYYKGIRLQGNVIELKPTQFLISESYITVVIDTKAQLQMNISGLSF
jgi:fructose-specific phosphotransferase system component IIB